MINFSGDRFNVTYSITGNRETAYSQAQDICVEQTIEFPPDLVKKAYIHNHILGKIESFEPVNPNRWEAVIGFAVEIAGDELTQLINVMFGNFSLKPGVRVERFELPASLLNLFKGPRFGVKGLRELLGVPSRPLFCTALKPMGLPVKDLADLAHQFAMSGVDMIKDDHGLADQPFHPFKERVERCAEAVHSANRKTGGKCLYIPNLSTASDRIMEKAFYAKEKGAGGFMLAPGLIGMDTVRRIAEDDTLGLPIIGHPAFQGTFVASPENGLSHYLLFGQLPRITGTDAIIFPNWGGRFSFTKDDCLNIMKGAAIPMNHIKPIFPMPGGGMTLERIPEMTETYGNNIILLIGGALHKDDAFRERGLRPRA